MTDRFALAYAGSDRDLDGRGSRTDVGRAGQGGGGDRPAGRGRRPRCARSAARYKGLCPFHQERTPSFTVTPARGTFKCFGCGEGGDAITFVAKTEQRRLHRRDRVARAALRRRDRVRGGVARSRSGSGERRRSAARAARAGDRLLRARALGVRAGAPGARVPRLARARRGGLPRVPARLRARRRDARPARAEQEGFTARGAARGRARRTGAATTTSSAGSSSRSPTRAAASAASRRASSTTTTRCQAKYVNSPRGRALPQGRPPLRPRHRRGRRSRRRSAPSIVEGNTDVIALRQAGFAPVVASMGTALTEAQLKELARLTKRLFLCFDADAAGQDATLRGMELAVRAGIRRARRDAAAGDRSRPTTRRRSRSGCAAPVSYPVHRVRLENERAPRPRRRRSPRSAPSSPRCPTRPSISRRSASRPTCSTCRRRRRPGSRRARGQLAHRGRRLAAPARRRPPARAQRARRSRRARVAPLRARAARARALRRRAAPPRARVPARRRRAPTAS